MHFLQRKAARSKSVPKDSTAQELSFKPSRTTTNPPSGQAQTGVLTLGERFRCSLPAKPKRPKHNKQPCTQATVHPNKHNDNQPIKRSFLGFFLALSKNPTAFYKLFTCLVQAGQPPLLKKPTNGFYKLFHLPRAGRTPPAVVKSLLNRAKWL